MNKIDVRRADLNDAPRLDAVRTTSVYGQRPIGRVDRRLTVMSAGNKQLAFEKGRHVRTTLHVVFHFILPGLLLTALAGCGGGGGGGAMQSSAVPSGSPPQTVQSVPAPPEPFTIYLTTLAASSGGNSYAGTYSETPNQGTTMFDGQEANSSAILLVITENGAPIVTETETVYYLENPYQPLGLTLSYNGGQFDFLYNSTNPLPSTLAVGDSGPLGSGTYYAANTHNAVGSLTETYTVTSNSNWLLLNTQATGTVNGQSISQTISYVVNGGEATGVASVEVLVNGTTLQFSTDCAGCWDY